MCAESVFIFIPCILQQTPKAVKVIVKSLLPLKSHIFCVIRLPASCLRQPKVKREAAFSCPVWLNRLLLVNMDLPSSSVLLTLSLSMRIMRPWLFALFSHFNPGQKARESEEKKAQRISLSLYVFFIYFFQRPALNHPFSFAAACNRHTTIPYVCLVLFKLYFVATLDIYMIIKLVCCLKAIWQWFALSHRNETLTGLFFFLFGDIWRAWVCVCVLVAVCDHWQSLLNTLPVCIREWLTQRIQCLRTHAHSGMCGRDCVVFCSPHLSPEERLWWSSCCVCVCV